MTVISAPDLATLRTQPHKSKLYLVIQQPQWRSGGAWTGYIWSGQVSSAVGTDDPVTDLTVTSNTAITLLDGMTVFIGSTEYGSWDRGVVRLHGDQTIAAAAGQHLYIAVSSELRDVQVGDYVVVLDEFRFWNRYPRVTEAAGVLTWYKDYGVFLDSLGDTDIGLLWDDLGADDGERREAVYPPVPVMGSHVVQFIDPLSTVDIDFDWSDSYATGDGATVDTWTSAGENGGAGWNSALENPAAQTYSNVSGLAGYRTTLEVETDLVDPIVEFRRGVRYVFTLRRPGETQGGDPVNAEPITDFELTSIQGDFSSGRWRTTVRVYDQYASELVILPGALVIVFAEDWYGSTKTSLGPLDGRENILFVGHIADGSIDQDSETGNVTFDVASLGELASRRENYPVPVEHDNEADEWYKAPDLTVDRAAAWYTIWHTTLPLITDFYLIGEDLEIRAQDFLGGNFYSTLDSFLDERRYARLLFDRYERAACRINRQLQAAGSGDTLWTLAEGDWLGTFTYSEVVEEPTSLIHAGGLIYAGGNVTPKLCNAPGSFAGYKGSTRSKTNLAIATQAELNTLAGRDFAYTNNQYPRLQIQQGNWRFADIWPQDYVIVSQATDRHTFSSDEFIPRTISYEYSAVEGVISTSIECEFETSGLAVDGLTEDIPAELPAVPPPTRPRPKPPTPAVPQPPPPNKERRILSCDDGVFVTNDFNASPPHWFAVNTGVPSGDVICWKIFRDPWHWWTTTTEKTMWGIFGGYKTTTNGAGGVTAGGKYLYKHENFPGDTWTLKLDAMDFFADTDAIICDVIASIEVEDLLYAFILRNRQLYGGGVPYQDTFTLLKSVDGGDNWAIVSSIAYSQEIKARAWPLGTLKASTAPHSAAQTLWFGVSGFGDALYAVRSLNAGAAWSTTLPGVFITEPLSTVSPYDSPTFDDSWVIITTAGRGGTEEAFMISEDANDSPPTWTEKKAETVAGDIMAFNIWTNNKLYWAYVGTAEGIWVSTDAGDTWVSWYTFLYNTSYSGLFERATTGALQTVLLHNRTANTVLLINGISEQNKTGNLLAVAPNITYITKFERDTIGSA